jgi:Spy/CpxP family protein refolding chaperone
MTSWCKSFITLVLAGFLVAIAQPASAQGFRWWADEKFQKEMKLTADQISRLEQVFQAAQPALRADERAVEKLEDELSKVFGEGKADEREFEQFVERVEAARANWRKNRTLMLFRLRCILTHEQHVKMKALREQRERERHPKGRDRDLAGKQ